MGFWYLRNNGVTIGASEQKITRFSEYPTYANVALTALTKSIFRVLKTVDLWYQEVNGNRAVPCGGYYSNLNIPIQSYLTINGGVLMNGIDQRGKFMVRATSPIYFSDN